MERYFSIDSVIGEWTNLQPNSPHLEGVVGKPEGVRFHELALRAKSRKRDNFAGVRNRLHTGYGFLQHATTFRIIQLINRLPICPRYQMPVGIHCNLDGIVSMNRSYNTDCIVFV
jgi:hypothetical protein